MSDEGTSDKGTSNLRARTASVARRTHIVCDYVRSFVEILLFGLPVVNMHDAKYVPKALTQQLRAARG
jgi:hypothetical protein